MCETDGNGEDGRNAVVCDAIELNAVRTPARAVIEDSSASAGLASAERAVGSAGAPAASPSGDVVAWTCGIGEMAAVERGDAA